MIGRLIPPIRRTVQVLSLLLVGLLPVLALYTHHHEAHAIDDLPTDDWRTAAIRTVDRVVGDDEGREHLAKSTQGTIWSLRLAGYSVSDPLAGAEAIVTSRSFYQPLMWSVLLPIVASLLLGRVFCGWICPVNTLLEVVDRGRRLLRIAEIRPRDVRFSLWNKYLVLALGLLIAGVTSVPFLALFYPPAVLSRETHLFVFGATLGLGLYFLLAIVLFELFVSRRWWCRYMCPGGALYSLFGHLRVVRVRRDDDKCVKCGECVRVCQFDLRPMLHHTTGSECTNCAACISVCDSDALHYRLTAPLPILHPDRAAVSTRAPESAAPEAEPTEDDRRSSATSKVLHSGLGLLLACFITNQAHAHHILGLPHYSYKDNYPQAPTLEYPATTGPYQVLMTCYPGTPVPGEASTVAFYIKHIQGDTPYAQPVTMRVLQTFTFGSSREIVAPSQREPFDNQHRYTVTFPQDGEYIVELTMDVEGRPEVIPFLVVCGNPTATKSIVVFLGGGLAVFLVSVRAIKKKRERRATKARSRGKLTNETTSSAEQDTASPLAH